MRREHLFSVAAVLMLLTVSIVAITAHNEEKGAYEHELTLEGGSFRDVRMPADAFDDSWTPIYTADDLNNIRTDTATLSGKYFLANDLEFDESPGNFIPMGYRNNGFSGILDGNGHVISGLNVNMEEDEEAFAALFGYMSGGEIRNLGIEDSSFTAISAKDRAYAAAFVAYADLSYGPMVIENCYNTASVRAETQGETYAYAGGIIGFVTANQYNITIENCDNAGTVTSVSTSSASSGGMIGSADTDNEIIISDCTNTGLIRTSINSPLRGRATTGGIIGSADSGTLNVKNSENKGPVEVSMVSNSGEAYIGGMIGLADIKGSATIENCTNTGPVRVEAVTSNTYAGGILGILVSRETSIKRCHNAGHVYASGDAEFYNLGYNGGIAGSITLNLSLEIEECYNTGTIELHGAPLRAYVGGITGNILVAQDATATIMNCCNEGTIKAAARLGVYTGGITGFVLSWWTGSSAYITNCHSIGRTEVISILSSVYAGGIAGYSGGNVPNLTITNCYFLEDQIYENGSVTEDRLCNGPIVIDGGSNADGLLRGEEERQLSGAKNDDDMRPDIDDAKNGDSIYFTGITDTNIPGWDFDTIWTMDPETGFPVLVAFPRTPSGPGDHESLTMGKGYGDWPFIIAAALLFTIGIIGMVAQRRGIEIEKIYDMVRTGSQIRPTPWVKYRGRMLTVGEDYTYSYGENIDGTGTVTVRLIGKRSTATATFRIISKGDPKQA